MPKKVYISQANQVHNIGPLGYNERSGMRDIQKLVLKEFARDKKFLAKANAIGVNTAYANTREANAWGADVYIALHSNAGGVGARGTIGFYYNTSSQGYRFARAIVNRVGRIAPGGNKGVRAKPGFIEINGPNAPACLIELEAHDWQDGVIFLRSKKREIARAIYEAVCAVYDYTPKPAVTRRVLTVPVPVVKPRWWSRLQNYLKSIK